MTASSSSNRDTKWADGLRGLASLLVVTAHLARSLAPHLLAPAMTEKSSAILLQLPFFRCLVMGRASVAVFAILSGYVNALKPIKQTRAGNIDAALSGIAKSAFRRTGRFMFPAIISTTLSWLVCQFGGYQLAKAVDSAWIRDTSPMPSASFAAAFADLFGNLMTTWTTGANQYDRIQWTLCYLLKGSMFVYLTLFATAYVQPRFRVFVYSAMYIYMWKLGDAVIGINIYAGLIFAELSYDPDVQQYYADHPYLFSAISPLLMVLGLYAMSYPEEHPEWSGWSRGLLKLGGYMFPRGSEFARFYPGVGANLLCLSIIFNSTAKRILSHKWLCWLGKLSFAIYLLHAPLIRTLLTWMLFGASARPPSPGKDDHGHPLPRPWIPHVSRWAFFFLLPLFYVVLYRIALFWQVHVDPLCAKATNWVEEKVFRDEDKAEKTLLLS